MKHPLYAIKKIYHGSFTDAVKNITTALQKQGFGILTEIDVKKTLKKKLNVEYPHYLILGACNPPNAYKALQAEKEIGLLLPCNVIIYQEEKTVYIAVMKPTAALTFSDNKKIAVIAKEVESKLINALHEAVKERRRK